jgi:hypothetical protein
MTSITIDSFRRFEKILHALADASTAEMATNLAGLFIEASAAKPDLITWRSLADRYGQSGAKAAAPRPRSMQRKSMRRRVPRTGQS